MPLSFIMHSIQNIIRRVFRTKSSDGSSNCSDLLVSSKGSGAITRRHASCSDVCASASSTSRFSGSGTESSLDSDRNSVHKKEKRSLSSALKHLSDSNYKTFLDLKSVAEHSHPENPLSDDFILAVAYSNAFDENTSAKFIKKFDQRYFKLNAKSLEDQLLSRTLFPIPDLRTLNGGQKVFYMRPSRFVPKETPTQLIIDNLVYVMNCMNERSKSVTEGIAFIANMDDWTMSNFSTDYCYQFMQALQGRAVPTRVELFLIVNPPVWFGKVWKIMKPMLYPSFRKKVKLVPEAKLSKYLAKGYNNLLPDDMGTGQTDTKEIVVDFVDERKFEEAIRINRDEHTRQRYFLY